MNQSYLEQRLEQLGIQPEQNSIRVQITDIEGINTAKVDIPIFESDEHGNILINYWDIYGNRIQYEYVDPDPLHNYNNKLVDYQRKRLRDPQTDAKYISPKGQPTYPFFPPQLVQKYADSTEIRTLVVTEGEFKAFKGALCGFDVVGIPGIQNLADKRTKRLYPDIGKLIQRCKVKNVVMLYDGDCLDISTKHLEQGTELTQRPAAFFNAMLRFHSFMDAYDVKTYFAHIVSDAVQGQPKGLDDLLSAVGTDDIDAVRDDLMRLGGGGEYFYRLNMDSFSTRLQKYFHLQLPDDFYSYHADVIGEKEFVFYGSKYKYNAKEEKLERTIPKDLMNYMRVGNEFYEIIKEPDEITGECRETRKRRLRQTIKDDFPTMKDLFSRIPKYKTFVNIPSHVDYKKIINDCYNLYYPMKHEPREGSWETIDKLMRHIFEEQYDVGMDYLQIMYQYPTQILPVICLVSKENETGKSTFFQFVNYIFGNNVSMVRPEDIDNQFNSYTAGKLMVYLEENDTADNSKLTEKIKALSTAPRIPMTMKGSETVEVANFTKFGLTSNHPTRFLYIGQVEQRFWVRIVKPLPKEELKDVSFKTRLLDEIPAFLYHLSNRKIVNPKVSRMWFAPEVLYTDALQRIKDEQRPLLQKKIEAYIRNLFIETGERELYYTPEQLRLFSGSVFDREDEIKLDNYLKNVLELKKFVTDADAERGLPSSNKKYTLFRLYEDEIDGEIYTRIVTKRAQGRCYVFPIERFLTPAEIEAAEKNKAPITEDTKPTYTQAEVPY